MLFVFRCLRNVNIVSAIQTPLCMHIYVNPPSRKVVLLVGWCSVMPRIHLTMCTVSLYKWPKMLLMRRASVRFETSIIYGTRTWHTHTHTHRENHVHLNKKQKQNRKADRREEESETK